MFQKLLAQLEKLIEKLQTVSVEDLYPTRETQSKTIAKIKASNRFESGAKRSFAQYRAQASLMPINQRISLNFFAAFTFPVFVTMALARKPLIRPFVRHKKIELSNKPQAVFFEPTDEVLPESLKLEFAISIRRYGSSLNFSDFLLLIGLVIRHPLSPYFALKSAYKIANYRYNFDYFSPKAMICCSEYSFTSSLMTDWCKSLGIEHINVMHGEKLFHLVDAFAAFDRFYVWSDFYLQLVKSLDCYAPRFIVEIPHKFKKFEFLPGVKEAKTMTCFLQVYDISAWQILAENLKPLSKEYIIRIRPHPRWMKMTEVQKIFELFEIEDPNKIGIFESFEKTDCICSGYSTVLFLGHLSKRKVVVDDISNALLFNRLKELDFGVLQRPYVLLSQMR